MWHFLIYLCKAKEKNRNNPGINFHKLLIAMQTNPPILFYLFPSLDYLNE